MYMKTHEGKLLILIFWHQKPSLPAIISLKGPFIGCPAIKETDNLI
jgi:hypothetical protein